MPTRIITIYKEVTKCEDCPHFTMERDMQATIPACKKLGTYLNSKKEIPVGCPYPIKKFTTTDPCPKCNADLEAQNSGVRCPKCGWWECY